jgi:lambda family phage minor tail protein L
MSISADLQSLNSTALIEMFVLDTSNIVDDGGQFYFHCGTNQLSTNIIWQGVEYIALPIETEGFDINTQGKLPKPKLRLANVQGIFSALISELDDLVGAKLIRRRTFAKYLDAVNFKSGNETADPSEAFPDDIWFFDRKVSETRDTIEWELASAYDLQGVKLPRRQVIQNYCQWIYRSSYCGYTWGAYYDKSNKPCGKDDDCCPKTLDACKARWPSDPNWNGVLPFGGFPGATRS